MVEQSGKEIKLCKVQNIMKLGFCLDPEKIGTFEVLHFKVVPKW